MTARILPPRLREPRPGPPSGTPRPSRPVPRRSGENRSARSSLPDAVPRPMALIRRGSLVLCQPRRPRRFPRRRPHRSSAWHSLGSGRTLGAFIRIEAPIPNRTALFDIGIAGPIAGFIPSCAAVLMGLSLSHPQVFSHAAAEE